MKLALVILALSAPLALAQAVQQPALLPACASPASTAFDVASVKPIDQDSGSFNINTRADSLKADGVLSHMLEFAYNLHNFQLSGGPGWLTTATWEVYAKLDQPPPDWASLTNDARNTINRQRMAAVLAQRFALKCHFETKQLPVYNLVVAKGGPRAGLAPTPADAAKKGSYGTHGNNRSNRMEATGVPVTSLAANLSQSLGRTVIDKTGLTGLYNLTLTYTADPDATSASSAADPAGPTIFTALEEQLGLKLESAKGPVPVLVIDSIDKPSDN
ncbi:MAG TPA: TIGR03435 family protein [Acidobacteriaceae bacterium]|nr:TIGR03435 family protein [Acidobacteriaceae bacterium]